MSDFGDYVDDDAFDIEPPDPEQVGIKLRKLRERLADDDTAIGFALLAWLRRQGALR